MKVSSIKKHKTLQEIEKKIDKAFRKIKKIEEKKDGGGLSQNSRKEIAKLSGEIYFLDKELGKAKKKKARASDGNKTAKRPKKKGPAQKLRIDSSLWDKTVLQEFSSFGEIGVVCQAVLDLHQKEDPSSVNRTEIVRYFSAMRDDPENLNSEGNKRTFQSIVRLLERS